MSELTPSSFRLPSPSGREDAEILSKPVVEQEEISLWDYWQVIRRRLWFITLFFLGTVLTTALVTLMMTPIYTAETTLLIERNIPHVLDIREIRSEPLPLGSDEYDFYRTQYAILKSRTLAASVIQEAGGNFDLTELLRELEEEMQTASANLEFERAALLRDQIMEVKSGTGITKIEPKRRPAKYSRNSGRRRSRV